MAINLNTIVYDIVNTAYGGESSDDANLSFRQVAYWVKQERSLLLSQMMSKKVRVPAACVEYLNCVYMEPVDASECCEVDMGIYVLRSLNPIPTTIQRNGRDSILAVESLDGERAFSETTSTRRKWNKYNKYTSSNQRWYIKNNHLYISCDMRIEAVSVTGVFEDPEDTWKVNYCTSSENPILSACQYDWEFPFPISMSMAEQVASLILQKRIAITLNTGNDETNNAKDDAGAMSGPPKQQAGN
jgi:hypothetical protein|tara:strand:- start:8492 stop:9223 length:732 start_codon:yes stop_codon:yes gene_type:complete